MIYSAVENQVDEIKYAKIIILGNSTVGKSSILYNYMNGEFKYKFIEFSLKSFLGIDFLTKMEYINSTRIKMQIWDTAGQERYRQLVSTYFKKIAGAIIVFDLTNKKSLLDVQYWLRELKLQAGENLPKVLIGNKVDLGAQLDIDEDLVLDLEEKLGKDNIFYTSAKFGTNIREAFYQMALNLYNQNNLLDGITSTIEQMNKSKIPIITIQDKNNNQYLQQSITNSNGQSLNSTIVTHPRNNNEKQAKTGNHYQDQMSSYNQEIKLSTNHKRQKDEYNQGCVSCGKKDAYND